MITTPTNSALFWLSLSVAAILPTSCHTRTPARPDPSHAQGGAAGVNDQAATINKTTDGALEAKEKAYQQLVASASKAAAAAEAATTANTQNPQQNLNTKATANELAVVGSNLGAPKAEDRAEATIRLTKALSLAVAEREAQQREYDKLVGEGKVRQETLVTLNLQADNLVRQLAADRVKFDTELKGLNTQLAQLASEAANSKAEEARVRRELAAQTRQKIALGCASVGALLFILGLVGIWLRIDLTASVCCFVGAMAAISVGVGISAVEDLLTQPWFWPAVSVLGLALVGGVGWFGYRTWQHRVKTDLTALQASTSTGAIQEMKNDAALLKTKLASLNLTGEAKALVTAELSKGEAAWKHLAGYLSEWHRDPDTGHTNAALDAKIKSDVVDLNLKTNNYEAPVADPVPVAPPAA